MASPVERGWLENELWGDPVSYDTYRHILAHGRPAVIGAYRECFDIDRLAAPGERERAVLGEWGQRGLTRAEASALFRRHGFAPQAAGGWARGNWIESREDGRRYITERSRRWLAEQKEANDG